LRFLSNNDFVAIELSRVLRRQFGKIDVFRSELLAARRLGTTNMHFENTIFDEAWLIHVEPIRDERGFFSRTFCEREFKARGLCSRFVQHSSSHTNKAGSLRGMHFQKAPYSEVKVVRCSKGSIWDVIIDLRDNSPTRGQWQGFALSDQSFTLLYIPKGFAHGFQTLTDDVAVDYLISEFYTPEAGHGVRYDDPAFSIAWPAPVSKMSERDRSWPDYERR
jgi:dTDP-4-dehydrorhamnose 3,5-epimerase